LRYNFSGAGHKVLLHYTHFFGRHGLMAGFNYHVGTRIQNRQHGFYDYRFYHQKNGPSAGWSANLTGPLGLDLGYQYHLVKTPRSGSLRPYLFYQFQSTFYKQSRALVPSPYGGRHEVGFGSFDILEHTLGIGVQPRLYKRWYANAGAGLGFTTFFGAGSVFSPFTLKQTERVPVFRVGVTYRMGGE
jgi:hypothetical protein